DRRAAPRRRQGRHGHGPADPARPWPGPDHVAGVGAGLVAGHGHRARSAARSRGSVGETGGGGVVLGADRRADPLAGRAARPGGGGAAASGRRGELMGTLDAGANLTLESMAAAGMPTI